MIERLTSLNGYYSVEIDRKAFESMLSLDDDLLKDIGVTRDAVRWAAALQLPATKSTTTDNAVVAEALELFNYQSSDLDSNIPPAIAHAGANHLIIALKPQSLLSAMDYAINVATH